MRPEQGPRAPLRLGPHHRTRVPQRGHFMAILGSAGRPCRRLVAAPCPSLTQSGLATGLRQTGCPWGVKCTFLGPNPRPGSTAPCAPGGSFWVPGPAGHPQRCAPLAPEAVSVPQRCRLSCPIEVFSDPAMQRASAQNHPPSPPRLSEPAGPPRKSASFQIRSSRVTRGPKPHMPSLLVVAS